MKLPVIGNIESLCNQCVALCCRYFALQIEKPKTRRDFEDLRWYILHEDASIFVEEGEWYLQINRKCRALLPDNRCGIYHNRPSICREYKTDGCDWHADAYTYDHLFTEPEQIEVFAREFFREKRRKQRSRAARAGKASSAPRLKQARGRRAGRARKAVPLPILKTA